MKVAQRRKEILNYIISEQRAVSGRELSEKFGVSRQIIVQDMSTLKADGNDILSTHSGYVIQNPKVPERVFKVFHTREQTENELNVIVDLGGTVVDVYVWHKVYGKMVAKLNIASRHHVSQFLEGVRTGKSSELMNITGGYHYHTVRADSEEALDRIARELVKMGLIVPGL